MIWILVLANAQASTYYLSDVGIRAFSRGGAYIAGADDISAQWYNPAALTRINGGHAQFYAAGVKQFINFDRTDYPGEGPLNENNEPTDLDNRPVSNEANIFPIPHIGVAHDFGIDNLTVLLGFTSPYATGIRYPIGGPQRYSMENSVVIHTFTGPSVAYRFANWVSLGAGVSWNTLLVGQERQVAFVTTAGEPCPSEREEANCDISFEARVSDMSAFAWNVGVLIEPPNKRWAIGAMIQPPIPFNATGELSADFSNNTYYKDAGWIETAIAKDNDVTMFFKMPLIQKYGLLFRPKDTVEIELSAVYEGWSAFPGTTDAEGEQKLIIRDVNLQIDTIAGPAEVVDDIPLDAGLTNSISLRLGWEWDISDNWTVRNGYFYETTGLPIETLNVGMVDRNKFGYGVGGSWSTQERWTIDAGLFQSFMGSWTIESSESKQVAIELEIENTDEGIQPKTTVTDGRTVSDGDYSSSALLFGLGVSYAF